MGRAQRSAGRYRMITREKMRRVPTVVTFLEMKSKPHAIPPPQPKGKVALLRAEHPPVHFYRYLYDAVGGAYKWVDRKKLKNAELAELLRDERLEVYVLYVDGCPAGISELDFREANIGQLAYFGLVPDYIGR